MPLMVLMKLKLWNSLMLNLKLSRQVLVVGAGSKSTLLNISKEVTSVQ